MDVRHVLMDIPIVTVRICASNVLRVIFYATATNVLHVPISAPNVDHVKMRKTNVKQM